MVCKKRETSFFVNKQILQAQKMCESTKSILGKEGIFNPL